ncbi:hypothetical protein ACWCL1_08295 [Ligilactobacillus sp. LYQ135]
MTKDEIVKTLNSEMQKINEDLSVINDCTDLTLIYKDKAPARFLGFEGNRFNIAYYKDLPPFIKKSSTVIRFYVSGQKLLRELDL